MKSRLVALVAGFLFMLNCAAIAFPAPDDWAEGTPGRQDGANRDFYNRAAGLRWRHQEGDWRDAEGVRQGAKPFATATVAGNPSEPVEWDLTELVRDWLSGRIRNKGILLRNTAGGRGRFHSREAQQAENRPQLVVLMNGEPQALEAVADTHLVRSTYKGQGNSPRLAVSGDRPALVRFDLSDLRGAGNTPLEPAAVAKATLRLVPAAKGKRGEIGVFLCDQGDEVEPMDPIFGLAARHVRDKGIEKDPDVLFATGFEADDWQQEWTAIKQYGDGTNDTVATDPPRKFEPLDGKACRVLLRKGSTGAMNVRYKFQQEHGYEPEEIYFRYYLRFGDDWHQTVQGGKMPGISGTYGNAGWGGRKVHGDDGWSARGSFRRTLPEANPLAGKQVMGWYCYHADMQGFYGSQWPWTDGYRGYLDNNRWYCVEQYVKLNTPGENGEAGKRDGILRAWISGRPAFEKTDIRFRDVDKLKIEQIWMNVYHGGTTPSPRDQHLYIDNVVVAEKYIGPMREQESK